LDVYTPIHTLGSWSPFALWERFVGCLYSNSHSGKLESVRTLGTIYWMFILQFTLWEVGVRSHSGNDLLDVYTPIHTLGSWSPFALWERFIGCLYSNSYSGKLESVKGLSCIDPCECWYCILPPSSGLTQ
jgi:hypothetical protein